MTSAMMTGYLFGSALREAIEADEAEEARKKAEQATQAVKLKQLQEEYLTQARYRLLNGRALPPGKHLNAALREDTDGSTLFLKLGDTPTLPAGRIPTQTASKNLGSQPEKDAYVRGKKDAADCKPMNSGGYCVGLSPEVTTQCVQNYQNGYRVGEKEAENTLRQAHRKGQDDKQAGRPTSSLTHGVPGTCGTHWYEAYNSGYRGTPFTMIGR